MFRRGLRARWCDQSCEIFLAGRKPERAPTDSYLADFDTLLGEPTPAWHDAPSHVHLNVIRAERRTMPVTIRICGKKVGGWLAEGGVLAFVIGVSTWSCGGEREPAKEPTQRGGTAEARAEVLPPLTVLQRLRGSEDERRACFGASGKATDGFVKLAWDIGVDGKVKSVAVEGTSVHDRGIEACLAAEVEKLDYGPRDTPARARWTFVHQLPKMPGAVAEGDEHRKAKKKREQKQGGDEEVAGVSIEEASPGSLDLGRIEDIVHAGFPLFAYCYRAGLERDPELGGLVRLRFVIDEEGAVMGVMDSGSEFDDPGTLDCMAEGIFALSFPAPTGGDVRVQYRILFEAG